MMRVLISGASIAGPALAFWLQRCGAATTVVEKSPELRRGGQAVDLRGVARRVAARMGLEEQIREACVHTVGYTTVDADGNPLASMRADEHDGDGQIAEIEILRGDLAQVLVAASRDGGTEYVFGDHITDLTEMDDAVQVEFAHSGRRTFDVVIGADGLHSAVRPLLFGEDRPLLHHLGTYIAFWTAPNHLGLKDWALDHSDNGRNAGIRPVHDNSESIIYFAFSSAPIDYDHRNVEQQKALVRERAAGMSWEVPALITAMDQATDFYFDSCSQVLLDTWSRGRVGLLGDAAYSPSPLTGQGTSLALVGAYVLAGELAAAGSDPAAGLAAYAQRMRDWVLATQRMGRAGADNNSLVAIANGFELPDYPQLTTAQADT